MAKLFCATAAEPSKALADGLLYLQCTTLHAALRQHRPKRRKSAYSAAHGPAVGVPLVTVGVALLEERLMLLPHKLLELRTLDARFSLLAAGNT